MTKTVRRKQGAGKSATATPEAEQRIARSVLGRVEDDPPYQYGEDWTEDARADAMRQFRRLAHWYTRSVRSYAQAPPEVRRHRARMMTIARILSATLAAHATNDETLLRQLEQLSRPYLRRLDCDPGAKGVADTLGHDNPKDALLESVLVSMHAILTSDEVMGRKIEGIADAVANDLIANFYDVFIDGLKDDAQLHAYDEAQWNAVGDAIRRTLQQLPLGQWPKDGVEIGERVIRAGLRALGHARADDFFDYRRHRCEDD
ncbi:hypothetical protein [Polyangium sp. 6x1]|uniref:hypothetical protein n=1 Tax=Polyangium sp. 6x1 TaxID=3042689 RepID=UPI0024824233|nr:hypothetical protein [Polyangium sp. 6x1]MDI1444225.1 hypothetical protein [Polyangium sp. 6x1]